MRRLFAVLLLLSGCTTPETVQQDTDQWESLAAEVNDEVVVGRQMAAKLMGHFGSDSRTEWQTYLSLVGGVLVRKIGRPEIAFHFGVLSSPEPNAFAAPGGYIFVTSGLMKSVRSESELAAVLAHEIAHINLKHMSEAILPKRDVNAGTVVVGFLSRGRSTLGVSLSSIVNRGMELLLEKGLGEEKEHEADTTALMYLSAVGYDPGALVAFLKRQKPGAHNPALSLSRVEALGKWMVSQGVVPSSSGENLRKERFAKAIGGSRG